MFLAMCIYVKSVNICICLYTYTHIYAYSYPATRAATVIPSCRKGVNPVKDALKEQCSISTQHPFRPESLEKWQSFLKAMRGKKMRRMKKTRRKDVLRSSQQNIFFSRTANKLTLESISSWEQGKGVQEG